MINYSKLAINDPAELIFGRAPLTLKISDSLTIGSGTVFPEINFTLPPMNVKEAGHKKILQLYDETLSAVLNRAEKLKVPGLILEFEELPPMTWDHELASLLIAYLRSELDDFTHKSRIPTALRVTVVDLRDRDKPPLLRTGDAAETTLKAFEVAAANGAHILSIESTGGKEVHDKALVYGDIQGVAASLGILAARDMQWLWENIVQIADKHNIIAGGDTACGFANTAMQLAGQGLIPGYFSALVRAASVPRSLIAYRCGAPGPSKDCAYEGPFMKAIAGIPISMEGRSSACAHFSPLGNIAAYAADLWSNESVQMVKLLSGSAPEVSMEQLAYDCRLFNSPDPDHRKAYRDLLIDSDAPLSPEARILHPEMVVDLSREVTAAGPSTWLQTRNILRKAAQLLSESLINGQTRLPEQEKPWIHQLQTAVDQLPDNEDHALNYLLQNYRPEFSEQSYGLR